MVTKVKALRTNLHVQFVFRRPILDWVAVPGRFFSMIYETQGRKFSISTNELSTNPATNLADVRVRYNLFGGASAVTLSPDKLSFDFPGLVPNELPIAMDIMSAVHDAWPSTFPDAPYHRVDVQSYEHLELPDGQTPRDFLQRFLTDTAPTAFSGLNVVINPAARFEVVAEDQTWQGNVLLERSLFQANALFAAFNISLLKFEPTEAFAVKSEHVVGLGQRFLVGLGLEAEDGTGA